MYKGNSSSVKILVIMGLFIALSVVGAYIKIPNPITNSIALDSLPAYLASLVLGGGYGAVVGCIGHLISAAVGGFPLSLPIHLIIALQMVFVMLIFGWIAKRYNLVIAIIFGIILNGVVAPATFILIPELGMAFFLGSVVFLVLATTLNVAVASIVYYYIRDTNIIKTIKKEMEDGI